MLVRDKRAFFYTGHEKHFLLIMHGLYDWMCFVTDPSVSSGVITGTNVTTGLIIAMAVDISLAIAGLYMIRPAVRDDIDAIWEKKWSIS